MIAENFTTDKEYISGTVLMFGGSAETTVADADTHKVAGIVVTRPDTLMNGALKGTNVAAIVVAGRTLCNVVGPVAKGDLLVSAGWGFAKTNNSPAVGTIVGRAVEDFPSHQKGVIEVFVSSV